MQTQNSPFGPLLGLPQMLPSPANPSAAVSLSTFPSAFAAFASQIRNTQLQSLLHSQIQALNSGINGNPPQIGRFSTTTAPQQNGGGKVRGTTEYPVRKRVGGSTVKTAKVWRYFDELPTIEQAAECRICRKKIKATNSSTTGMIRHLRSCHVQEYQLVQEARQNSMIVKMEEKARAKLLREMNDKVTGDVKKEPQAAAESQKSPSASSSASDTASSSASSFSQLIGLPAPIAIKPPTGILNLAPVVIPTAQIKTEATEVEEEPSPPQDLSLKMMMTSPKLKSAFCAIPSAMEEKMNEFQKKIEEDHKIHMQIALMLLLDQQPSHLIDRPGFRSLFKFLLPDYHLPTGDIFQATIVPQLLNHMKQQIGAIFSGNAPPSNVAIHEQVMTSHVTSTTSSSTSSYEEVSVNESAGPNIADDEEEMMEEDDADDDGRRTEENVEIEDDTSSASSSVDTDTCDAISSFIHFIGNDVFPHEELMSLLSVVSNIFAYFSTRPHVQTHLQMTVIPATVPEMSQQIRFVASNLIIISDYIRQTPDMQLLPLAANQENLLERLVDHIDLL